MLGLAYKKPIVFDYANGKARAGFAGDDAPIAEFPSIVGRPKEVPIGLFKDHYVGNEAQRKRDLLNLEYPIEDNLVKYWDDMEKIWDHAFYSELLVAPEEHPVMLNDSPLNPKPNRETMAQFMFEEYGFPAMYVASQPSLYLNSIGRTTGVVTDIGDGVTYSIPVYEGRVNHEGTFKSVELTGRELTDHLINLIVKGRFICSPEQRELAQGIKETVCYVALDYEAELARVDFGVYKSYELPDGHLFIGPDRFKCPEALFQPYLAGKAIAGIHEATHRSILACDVGIRKDLYKNIMLTGGATMFPGIAERMTKEVKVFAPNEVEVKALAPRDKDAAWFGGSLYASLNSFEQVLVTKAEYAEYGARIINMKCF